MLRVFNMNVSYNTYMSVSKNPHVIEVKNLVKRYKKAQTNAVNDVSFHIKKGEFFAFLGPNGAGKTTTISILTTTLSKTSGMVMIAGYDSDNDQDNIRRNIGVIFQNPSLDLQLSAEENIRFHAIMYGMYQFAPTFALMPKEYRDKVYELSELLDIRGDIFKQLKSFSGGMKRKLEIVRGLMHNPTVLFLDEPTVGLDPISRKNLWDYLNQMRKSTRTTIFLTTHYLDEAEEADSICIINHGAIVAWGSPSAIKRDLVQEYLMIRAKNQSELRRELETSNIPYVEHTHGFEIQARQQDVHHILRTIETPLTTVKTHAPSLEQAYVEIINKGDTNNHA